MYAHSIDLTSSKTTKHSSSSRTHEVNEYLKQIDASAFSFCDDALLLEKHTKESQTGLFKNIAVCVLGVHMQFNRWRDFKLTLVTTASKPKIAFRNGFLFENGQSRLNTSDIASCENPEMEKIVDGTKTKLIIDYQRFCVRIHSHN